MIELSADVRQRLNEHLDAVEQTLQAAGMPRDLRRSTVDDLETQILDMVARHSPTPTPADMDAVLAQVDPPAAYGQSNPTQTQAVHPHEDPETPASPVVQAPAPLPKPLHPKRRTFFMRSSVLVTLIICGTLLVLAPAIADHLKDQTNLEITQAAAKILAQPGVNTVNLSRPEPMQTPTKFGFWLTGTMAIVAGVIGGFVAFYRETRVRPE